MTTAITGVAAASAVAAYMVGSPGHEREDCPGKIICPITGELICADQCPAEAAKSVGQAPADDLAQGFSCCDAQQ